MSAFLLSGIAIILYIGIAIAFIAAWSQIFLNAGYNRWLCFLMIIPVVNVIMLFWFAWSKWPILHFVQPDWRIKMLQQEKAKLEKEINILAEAKSTDNQPNIPYQNNSEKSSGISEWYFLLYFVGGLIILMTIIIVSISRC